MSEPLVNIYLIGFMGCGKSYWGRKLSQKLKIPSCDIDHIIEIKEKSKISDIFYNNGEDYFRKKEYQVLQDLISINEACIVSCGGGTPCFNNNMELMNSHGITIYLKASKEYLFNHLKINRKIRPSIAKLNDTELRNFIDIKLDERKVHYEKAMYIIDIENIKPCEFYKQLKDYRQWRLCGIP